MFSYYSLSEVDTVLNISTFWIYATQYTSSTTSTCLWAVDKEYSRAITRLFRIPRYFELVVLSLYLKSIPLFTGVTTLTNAVWAILGLKLSRPGNWIILPNFWETSNKFPSMSRFFSAISRNYRAFPDSRRNLQIPGTILALSRNSVC